MRVNLLIVAAVLAPFFPAAQAAERVTLSNGFSIGCDHHSAVEDHMRLYLGAGEDNYIEFPAERIARIDTVPDLVPEKSTAAAAKATPEAKLTTADLNEILSHAGQAHNIDVDLLASVVKAESGGNPRALSHAGAQGLMQLMPSTANGLGVRNSYLPDENVRGGSTYLDELLVRYHDSLALALAAYNAGPAAVDKYHGIPPYHETRAYVARVIHEFNRRVMARAAQARNAPAAVAVSN